MEWKQIDEFRYAEGKVCGELRSFAVHQREDGRWILTCMEGQLGPMIVRYGGGTAEDLMMLVEHVLIDDEEREP